MADGTVLVSGGTEKGWGDMNRVPVLASEIFGPVSETFRLADSALTDRRYHSIALLQPDGTVLKAGSTGGFAHDPDTNESLFDEHATAERYYPPYLYRGPRPAITAVAGANDAWTTLGYDTEVDLQARGAGLDAQSKVALIRFGSTTHGNNMDQRYVWLRTTAQDSDAYERWTIQFRTPETSAVAPVGDDMLVVVDSTGVPSSSASGSGTRAARPPSGWCTGAFRVRSGYRAGHPPRVRRWPPRIPRPSRRTGPPARMT